MERAQSLAESQKAHTKRVLQRYSRWVRRASQQRGYQAGLCAAEREITELVTRSKQLYDQTIDAARADIATTSCELAQRVVDKTLMEHPDSLMRWIDQALVVLKRSRTLQIRYNPRLEIPLQQLAAKLPDQIQLIRDETLAGVDLAIHGDSGGVEFSRLISAPTEVTHAY